MVERCGGGLVVAQVGEGEAARKGRDGRVVKQAFIEIIEDSQTRSKQNWKPKHHPDHRNYVESVLAGWARQSSPDGSVVPMGLMVLLQNPYSLGRTSNISLGALSRHLTEWFKCGLAWNTVVEHNRWKRRVWDELVSRFD